MTAVIEEDFSGFDWDTTESGPKQYSPLPEGQYPVRIAKAEVKTVAGREGDFKKLALQLQVRDGVPHAGRIIFDDLILNDKEGSKKRRAIVWRRLGLVEKGAQHVSINEHDLVGKECTVDVVVAEYTKRDGTKATKNEVTFDGYNKRAADASAGEGASGEPLSEGSCPF